MNINVTIDNLDLNSVVRDRFTRHGDQLTLADLVAERIVEEIKGSDHYPSIVGRVERIRDEEIREAIRPEIAAAMEQPIQRTNEFGTPTGNPVPLTEMIIKQVHSYLTQRDRNSTGNQTVAQKLVAEAVKGQVGGELRKAVEDEKAKVVVAVRAKAAELIAEAVTQGVGRGR